MLTFMAIIGSVDRLRAASDDRSTPATAIFGVRRPIGADNAYNALMMPDGELAFWSDDLLELVALA